MRKRMLYTGVLAVALFPGCTALKRGVAAVEATAGIVGGCIEDIEGVWRDGKELIGFVPPPPADPIE